MIPSWLSYVYATRGQPDSAVAVIDTETRSCPRAGASAQSDVVVLVDESRNGSLRFQVQNVEPGWLFASLDSSKYTISIPLCDAEAA